jgi:penicillin amidase
MTRNRYETFAGVSMRKSFAVAGLSLLFACAGSESKPALTITPNGTQTIHGPTEISASEADVTWSISSGPGSLSVPTGQTSQNVIYHPAGTTGTATVTASANGQTATVTFNFTAPTSTIPGAQIPNTSGNTDGLSTTANVVYDEQGIPHIFCANVQDCFAVQGFLHAQDRLFQMDLFRRTAEGRLSSLLGSVEFGADAQILHLFTTRDGKYVTDKMAEAIDSDSKAKLDAYVNGINTYLAFLRAHPQLMPGEYAQISAALTPNDIPDWTETDSFAIGRLQQFQLSESIEEETAYGLIAQVFQSASPGRVGAYIRAQQPIRDYTLSATDPAATAVAPLTPAATMAPWLSGMADVYGSLRSMRETFGTQRLGAGSNNWVVDKNHSATGQAMVANDPHLQLFFPPLFHLSAMTSADGAIDLSGGSFPGVPGALVGRGQHVGWGVTVVGYDVTDLYLETVDPTCGGTPGPQPCVFFANTFVPEQTVTYNGSNGIGFAGNPVTVHVVPHHGPIITPDNSSTVISMRWTGHEATNDFRGFFGLATATGVGTTADTATATTAFGALKNYKVGAQNFVLADDAGNIGYDPHALVPSRPWAGTVVTLPINGTPTPVPLLPWIPLPGIGVAEWGGTPACALANPAATCWVDDSLLPQAVNPTKGYLATANSDPIGTTDDNDPINNPNGVPYLSFDWDDPTTVRYARIASLLAKKTANNGKVSMQDMQDIQSDHTIQLAALFLATPHFADSISSTATDPAHIALGMIQAWQTRGLDCPTGLTGTSPSSSPSNDPNVVANSAACLVFHQFVKTLLVNTFNDDFAFVQHAAGQNPGGDFGRELRTMLFMLGLPANSTGTEFCNNINTSTGATVTAHSCADQVNIALGQAFNAVAGQLGPPPAANATTTTWVWGKFHTLTTLSPAAPLIAGGFSGGPFARPGGALSVDVGNPDGSALTPLAFSYSHGSNVRHISEVKTSTDPSVQVLMQLPGMQHDAPFQSSSTFPDLLTPYAANQYFQYPMNHQVDSHAVSTQGFAP